MRYSLLKISFLSSLLWCQFFVHAQAPGTFDLSFHCYTGFGNEVYTIAPAAGGKKIIGGMFSNYQNNLVAKMVKLNPDNSIDGTFSNGFTSADVYRITEIAPSNDGGYFVGGAFTKYAGVSVGSIMKIDADGNIDSTFNDTGSGFPYSTSYAPYKIAQLPDNKILIAGLFSSYNGVSVNKIFRLMPDGTIDPTFVCGVTAINEIYDFEVLADNTIIIAGDFSYTSGGVTKYDIQKLNSDGSVNNTFHLAGTGLPSGISYYLYAVEITPDGKILIGGYFTSVNGTSKYGLARLNSDGTLDAGFLAAPLSGTYVYDLYLYSDKIYVGGDNIKIGGYTCDLIALNNDGSVFTSFPVYTGAGQVSLIKTSTDNKFLIGGDFSEFGSRVENNYIQLNADGTIDESANSLDAANSSIYSIADNLDGQSYAGGTFTIYDKYTINRIVKLKSDGAVDTSFHSGTGFNDIVRHVVRQPNGRIIVAGDFTSYNGVTKNHLARLYPDGTVDPLFNIGSGPVTYSTTSIKDIDFMSDGKIIVAGNFSTFSGISKSNIVKLFTNGTVDLAFNPASISGIYCVEIQSDNKIIVGGSFTTVNGISKKGLVRLNVNGTMDPTFNIGTGGSTIYDCDRTADGKLMIVGSFLSYDGVSITRIARLFSNGSIDTSFHSGIGSTSTIDFVKCLPDGHILISGGFSTYNGIPTGRMVLLNSDGTLNSTFLEGIGIGLDSDPYATVLQSNGKILIGGVNDEFDVYSFHNICRVNGPGCESIYDTIVATIATGESYLLPDGTSVTTSGTYITTADYMFDCDYITVTILTVIPPPCNIPPGILVSNITSSSAKVSWTAVAGATQYNLWYRKTGVASWTKKNVAGTSKTLTGLLASTTYEYKLRSQCGAEYSAFSPITTFTTLPLKQGEISSTDILIFPNPNNGQFIVDLASLSENINLTIINMTGAIIYQNTAEAGEKEIEIDIHNSPPGIYHLTIESSFSIYSTNLIIR